MQSFVKYYLGLVCSAVCFIISFIIGEPDVGYLYFNYLGLRHVQPLHKLIGSKVQTQFQKGWAKCE